MKLSSPFIKLKGKPIVETLGYGDTSFAEAYKRLGWSIRAHNGRDYVCGVGRTDSYGLPIIATQDGIIQKVTWDSPMSTKGNGITLQGNPFTHTDGKQRILSDVYWHLSDVTVQAGQQVKQGQTIGYLGNSGFVVGDNNNPYGGTHLHYMVYEYEYDQTGKWVLKGDNALTGGTVDPNKWLHPYWKENAPVIDKIEIEKQLHPLKWILDKAELLVLDIKRRINGK
jgi:murein DD-endopeptidase MepM/ murein hydrolase activator NlpD